MLIITDQCQNVALSVGIETFKGILTFLTVVRDILDRMEYKCVSRFYG